MMVVVSKAQSPYRRPWLISGSTAVGIQIEQCPADRSTTSLNAEASRLLRLGRVLRRKSEWLDARPRCYRRFMSLTGCRAPAAACITWIALLAAAGGAEAATLPSYFEERTIASGLTVPVAVAWAPDGRTFIAEKAGRIRVVLADGTLQAAPLIDISDHVNNNWDHGLLGLAVDSNFAANHYLYLLYVYEPDAAHRDDPKVSRLTRIVVKSDNTVQNPQGPETVLLGSVRTAPCPAASNTLDCMPADSITHAIGTVRSAPDGTLFVGSGDAADFNGVDQRAFRTYDERSYAGKILHVDRNGRGLSDHPFCSSDSDLNHVCTKVFAKGFRNPFRFTLRPGGGLIVGDVGWNSWEEINLPAAGGNYGWPCYEGNHQAPGYSELATCAMAYQAGPAATAAPFYEYFHEQNTGTALGGPLFTGDQYPEGYKGSIFFGDYALGVINRLELNSDGTLAAVKSFATDASGIVDLELSPAGNLAYVEFGDGWSATGTVREIEYSPGNLTPVARATATPTSGDAPLEVTFHGSDSSDPDGDPLSYDWDFGDGSPHGSQADPVHIYQAPGSYTARLTVDDGRGRTARASVAIIAGNTPPDATISAPASGTTYRDGLPVGLSGSATDPQEGELSGSALAWHVIANHGGHLHDVGGFAGAEASFTPVDDHDADTYYDVFLTATDSQGLSSMRVISVYPQTVELTVESRPEGAAVSFGGLSLAAPFSRLSAVGFRTTVAAAERLDHAGRTYVFERWSDGGARLHDIAIPGNATTLVAIYRDPSPLAPVAGGTVARDTEGPRIGFNRPTTGSTVRRLTGTATDPSGIGALDVAIRIARKAGTRCRWVRPARRGRTSRRGRIEIKRGACTSPVWIRAGLEPAGLGRWAWRAPLGRRLPTGRYVISFRATDLIGNWSAGLAPGGSRARIAIPPR
jgi:glucose/arabinose dehydrogenase